ncbi:MAG: hypothetical protein Q8921_14780 [Bacteroidota bacterium]|nr:hypothetical protein [Bacteroidota bacterium]
MTITKFARLQPQQVMIGMVYLLLAWTFANIYDYVLPHNLDVTVEQLTTFTARRPMQLRVLMPAIIHVVSVATSLRIDTVNKLTTIVELWAILLLFGRFLSFFVSQSRAWIAAPLILVPLFWNYCLLCYMHFSSDLAGIALFLALLILRHERKWVAWYVLFAMACFNRETILFALPCLMALWWRERSLRSWLTLAIASATIWIAVRVFLNYLFRDSPGGPFENHLAFNLGSLEHAWTSNQGVVRYFIFLFGGMHIVSFALWKWTPRALRSLLLVSLLFWAVMLPVGILLESRIFGELIPIYCASTIVAMSVLFRTDVAMSPEPLISG